MTFPLSTVVQRLAALLLVAAMACAFGTSGALAGTNPPADTADIATDESDDSSDIDTSDGGDDTADLTNETGDDGDTADLTNETGDDGTDDTADLTNETGDDGTDDTADLTNETGDDDPADDDSSQGDEVEELPNTGAGTSNGTGMIELLAIAGVLLAVGAGVFWTRKSPRAG